jgi:outer membrane receptor protein involved in Fe transport
LSGRSIQFVFTDSTLPYGLEQEVAFNTGLSFEHEFRLGYMPTTLGFDYFYSQFINEVVVDRETAGVASFYNVENGTRAHSFQTQLDLQPARRSEVRLAYRMFDVKTPYRVMPFNSDIDFDRPLISRHRAFINVTQRTRSEWQFSSTATWYGSQRIPGIDYVGGQQGYMTNSSPSFFLWNAQLSKIFKKQFEVYVGAENILNYRQENPIQEAANPFSDNFDAGLVWGPVFGRMFYGGFRWRLKGAE